MYSFQLGDGAVIVNLEKNTEEPANSRTFASFVPKIMSFSCGRTNGPNNDMIEIYIKKLKTAPITTIGIQYISPKPDNNFDYLEHFNNDTVSIIHIDAPLAVNAKSLVDKLIKFKNLQELCLAQMSFFNVDPESKNYFKTLYEQGKLKPYGPRDQFNKLLASFGVSPATTSVAPTDTLGNNANRSSSIH